MTREDVVQYICIYFFKKVNISEIKYNSSFGTRAICSNIFQRMSRRCILENLLTCFQKRRIKSYVSIQGSLITLRHSSPCDTKSVTRLDWVIVAQRTLGPSKVFRKLIFNLPKSDIPKPIATRTIDWSTVEFTKI